MTGLLEACLRIPTVIFTIGLGVVMLYWLFVLIGALDIDLFGSEGVGDALAGAKGAGEAVKVEVGHHDAGGFWDALGLGTVPITVSASVVMLVGWVLSILGIYYGETWLGGKSVLLTLSVLVGTIVISIPVAGLIVRPLNPVFRLREGKGSRDYIGSLCTITTGRVDQSFGQAIIEEGGTVLVIAVVSDKPEALKRNDRALIIDFDPTRHAYLVEPADKLLT